MCRRPLALPVQALKNHIPPQPDSRSLHSQKQRYLFALHSPKQPSVLLAVLSSALLSALLPALPPALLTVPLPVLLSAPPPSVLPPAYPSQPEHRAISSLPPTLKQAAISYFFSVFFSSCHILSFALVTLRCSGFPKSLHKIKYFLFPLDFTVAV